MMSDAASGKQYSWAMQDANVLALSFDTPDILDPYTAVVVRPGQEALVFTDDQQLHLREIGTHLISGNMQTTVRRAFEILRAGGTVHTSFSSAITIFDMRSRVLPAQSLTLPAADGSETHLSFGGAYRIADPAVMVAHAMTFRPGALPGTREMHLEDAFIQDTLEQIVQTITGELRRIAQEAPDAGAARTLLTRGACIEAVLRLVNQKIRATGMMLERFRPTPTERTCPYCHRALTLMELRSRRCGDEHTGCGRTLHTCPDCGAIVSPEHAACPRCRSELLWCDRCRAFAQVEHGRFCLRCRTACYPLLPRELLRHT